MAVRVAGAVVTVVDDGVRKIVARVAGQYPSKLAVQSRALEDEPERDRIAAMLLVGNDILLFEAVLAERPAAGARVAIEANLDMFTMREQILDNGVLAEQIEGIGGRTGRFAGRRGRHGPHAFLRHFECSFGIA